MSLVHIHFNDEKRVLTAGPRVRSLDGAVLAGQTLHLAPRPRA